MPCRIHGCNARKKIDEYGYCPAHKEKHASENNAAEFVKINDKLDKVLEELKGVKEENSMLRKENATLRAKVNLNFFSNDALNQYGRKEIFRIHDYPEPVVVPSPALMRISEMMVMILLTQTILLKQITPLKLS